MHPDRPTGSEDGVNLIFAIKLETIYYEFIKG